MIDIGRKLDMEALMKVVNDSSEPLFRRRRAHQMMMSIKDKMSDPFIARTRLRLIGATINNDLPEVEKLSGRIQDYEYRYHRNRKY